MNVLFVCSFGNDRSPTAAELYNGFHGIFAASGGTHRYAKIRVTGLLVTWATEIIVFQGHHVEQLHWNFGTLLTGKTIRCLGIQNRYTRGSLDLQARIVHEMKRLHPAWPSPDLIWKESARTALPSVRGGKNEPGIDL